MPASRAQVRLAHEVLEGRSAALPPPVAQEIVTKMHGHTMASLPERVGAPSAARRSPVQPEHFIQNSIKRPGALTAKAHRAGESPMQFARGHTHTPGLTGSEARFALLLNHVRPKGKVKHRIRKRPAPPPMNDQDGDEMGDGGGAGQGY